MPFLRFLIAILTGLLILASCTSGDSEAPEKTAGESVPQHVEIPSEKDSVTVQSKLRYR